MIEQINAVSRELIQDGGHLQLLYLPVQKQWLLSCKIGTGTENTFNMYYAVGHDISTALQELMKVTGWLE